jgi:hypothetical protein
MVRASVLDAALQLRLGTNAKVARWLLNLVPEEHEDDVDDDGVLGSGAVNAGISCHRHPV